MKLLDGQELAGFIKERQAKEVRRLKQAENIQPKLAIVLAKDDPVITTYVQLKQQYGRDIGVEVEVRAIEQSALEQTLAALNTDDTVQGIIVQLPLADTSQTPSVLNAIAPSKDVDGLGENASFDPATPVAINWLLAGYNVDLRGKHVLIVGQGPLVGTPLARIFRQSGLDVETADKSVKNLQETTLRADVIVTATGQPGLISSDMIKPQTVVIDAGVASEAGTTKGDVAPNVYERDDLTITPQRGGVGPLTVSALLENVLRAARNTIAQ